MENPVIIIGAKGIGKAALDIFQSHHVDVYGFLDDDKDLHQQEINHVPVLGNVDDADFLSVVGKKCEAFVALDENSVRENIIEILKEQRKVMPVNAIHQHAMVSENAHIGHGNFINAGAVVGTGAKVPNHCIIHSGAVIDHEAILGDFVQIGAGTIINAGVNIGEQAFIGSGVTVVSGVEIGKGARVGAGSVVVQNVKDGETVFGNPAVPVKS